MSSEFWNFLVIHSHTYEIIEFNFFFIVSVSIWFSVLLIKYPFKNDKFLKIIILLFT